MSMKPAKIQSCDAKECAYNIENKCHALAITVGGDADHLCDTFCPASQKGGDSHAVGMVGACKVTNCTHNKNFECAASQIFIGHWGRSVDCLSYSKR